MKIHIDDFSKKFRSKQLFNHQDLVINLKEQMISFITGDNGAGKSTLMRIISGILFVSSGKFESIENDNYLKWSKENCYYMPATERGLTYKLTGVENIVYLCSLKGSGKKETLQQLKHYATLFKADSILNKKVEELSTGQKRKIHLLVALCCPCKVLLLDEPSIGLDEDNTELLINILNDVSRRLTKKIIIISHEKYIREKLMKEEIHIDKNNEISIERR